ncbi:hypothetical protein [Sulfitobacter sp. R18_1]|uniref:hypothetical protein n=1 Tax=Sulfitobacter sp. R18_1 TaxID=2821104 RepID=UPI001ADC6669|nr:hypothetical protein [Sulfitobacter sp. R18_1]MBO9428385.1 hypothetical protein [Sulfitobacter sp. R18_1]
MKKILLSGVLAMSALAAPLHAAESGFLMENPLLDSPIFGGNSNDDGTGATASLDNGGEFSFTPNVSTLGYGFDVGYKFNQNLGVRGVYSTYDWDGTYDYEGTDFNIDADFNSYGAMVDFHPFGGGLTIGVGARRNQSSVAMDAAFNGTFNYNGTTYTHPDETVVNGEVTFPKWAPVVSVGYHGNIGDHVSFNFDLGAMHQGAASIMMAASGGVADDPSTSASFRNEMEEQRQNLEDELSEFKVYPIAKVGLSIRF